MRHSRSRRGYDRAEARNGTTAGHARKRYRERLRGFCSVPRGYRSGNLKNRKGATTDALDAAANFAERAGTVASAANDRLVRAARAGFVLPLATAADAIKRGNEPGLILAPSSGPHA